MNTLKTIISLVTGKKLIIIILLSILSSIFEIFTITILPTLIDNGVNKINKIELLEFSIPLTIFVPIYIFALLIGIIVRYQCLQLTIYFTAESTSKLYQDTIGNIPSNKRVLAGEYDNRFLKSMLSRGDLVHSGISAVLLAINGALILIGICLAALFISATVTTISVIFLSCLFMILALTHKKSLEKMSSELNVAVTKRFQIANDITTHPIEINLSGNTNKYKRNLYQNEVLYRKLLGKNSIRGKAPRIFIESLFAIAICFSVFFLDAENITGGYGQLAAFVLIFFKAIPPAQQIYSGYLNLNFINSAIKDLYNLKSDLQSFSRLDHTDDKITSIEIRNLEISFENNTIKYPKINLYRDKLNVITGRSGSGKSTLSRALMGLVAADVGSITFVSETGLKVKSFRNFAYCGPQPAIMYGSINENLEFYTSRQCDPDLTDLLADISAMDFNDFVNTGRLSSGQIQRVSFVRTLNSDAQILLFDEPTSNLDLRNAAKIKSVLHKNIGEKFIIIISHDQIFTELNSEKFNLITLS